MTTMIAPDVRRRSMLIWGAVALVFLLPVVATGLSDEMRWDAADFAIFAAILVSAGVGLEIALRTRHRLIAAVMVVAAFALIWVDLAVGIVGDG